MRRQERWRQRLADAQAYVAANGGLPSNKAADRADRSIRSWVDNQRAASARGELSDERIAALEAAGWAEWKKRRTTTRSTFPAHEARWHEMLEEVRGIFVSGGTPKPGTTHGRWVQKQRDKVASGSMRADRLAILDAEWWWSDHQTRPSTPTAVIAAIRSGRFSATEIGGILDAAREALITATSAERAVGPVVVGDRILPPVSEWRTDEGIQCLECGEWKRALGRHLRVTHDLGAAEYRALWGMRQRQPLTCGEVSEQRRQIAIRSGGVERLTEWAPKIADQAHAAAAKREHRPQERAENSAQSSALRESDRQAARDRIARADLAILDAGFPDRAAWLREHYWSRTMTLRECDQALDVAHGTCQAWMREAGIERRSTGPR